MNTNTSAELLGVADIRKNYNLGRDLTTELMLLLPHIVLGQRGRGDRRVVRRSDFDRLIERAAEERRDLRDFSSAFTPDTLRAWLVGNSHGAN
jgi:hypothetical protein